MKIMELKGLNNLKKNGIILIVGLCKYFSISKNFLFFNGGKIFFV